MIETVVNGILALADPHYLASVNADQLGHDLIDEVRFFGLFSESEMIEVERYIQRLVEERHHDRLFHLPVNSNALIYPSPKISDRGPTCFSSLRNSNKTTSYS